MYRTYSTIKRERLRIIFIFCIVVGGPGKHLSRIHAQRMRVCGCARVCAHVCVFGSSSPESWVHKDVRQPPFPIRIVEQQFGWSCTGIDIISHTGRRRKELQDAHIPSGCGDTVCVCIHLRSNNTIGKRTLFPRLHMFGSGKRKKPRGCYTTLNSSPYCPVATAKHPMECHLMSFHGRASPSTI